MSSQALGKKGNERIANIFIMSLDLCARYVDYENDNFIHAPTYTRNKVIWLLELVGVVECE